MSTRSPQTLRWRVAAAAAAAIALATALLGVAAYVLVSRELAASTDRALRAGAVQVAQLATSAPALLTAPAALEGQLGGRRLLLVEVVDRRRRLVARSSALGGQPLPLERVLARVIASGRATFTTTTLRGEPLRAYVAPLPEVGGAPAAGGAVVVAAGTASDAGTLARLRVLVLVAAVLAAVVAGVAALVLTRRALRPLHRLSEAAAGIERTGDATRRLPQPTHRDEVAELAATLNGMLASLQQAGERERRFVADASHELRTPVTALRGNIDYVADHGADAAVLVDLQHDVARLAALLDDLLALARVDAGAQAFAPVRLDEVARGVADRPQVHVDVPGPVLVHGDRAALERALRNLVENAERYGPPGGRIDVRVRQQGTSAVLTVQDTGAGVPPADAERVFERFWRGEGADRPPGSGLGLAIVRATAERHRGRASVQGSTFALELPAQDGTGR